MKKVFRSFFLAMMLMLGMVSTSFAAMPEISSDSRYFDFASGCFVLDGNVTVSKPGDEGSLGGRQYLSGRAGLSDKIHGR